MKNNYPTLPRDSTVGLEQRKRKLAAQKKKYAYSRMGALAPLPEVRRLPIGDRFDYRYLYRRSKPLIFLVLNDWVNKLQDIIRPSRSKKKFSGLFKLIPKPMATDNFLNDENFAWQRLAGVNPVVISLVKGDLPDKLKLTEDKIKTAFDSNENLKSEIAAGKVYVVNYELLSRLRKGEYLGTNKVVHDPIVVFHLKKPKDECKAILMPVLIQLTQKGEGNDELISAEEGDKWELAKWYCQVADAHHHQFVSHLTWSHLVFEPFPIATKRQLSSDHPVSVLLSPHFKYSLAINDFGRRKLLRNNGYGENLFAIGLNGLKSLITEAYECWSFDDSILENDIRKRGMESIDDYPYRDDGLLIWGAIKRYVSSYLEIYYQSDDDVIKDVELKEWLAELRSEESGNIKGLPSSFDGIAELGNAIGHIIYIGSVYHSALNYPQWDYMGSPLNMATSAYADEISSVDSSSLLNALPPHRQALKQMNFIYYISQVYHNYLGKYDKYDFIDPKADKVIQDFQSDLSRVEAEIRKRNGYRHFPYTALLPSRLANSLNS